MNEPEQIKLFDTVKAGGNRQVVYVPPDIGVLEELAVQACVALGKERDPAYSDPEIAEGLGAFLTVVARLTAKSLTKRKATWIKCSRRNK